MKNKTDNLSPLESWAMNVFKKILKKLQIKKLDNLVFYWDEVSCNCIYVNNSEINGKSETDVQKHIKDSEGDWLDGTQVDVFEVVEAEDLIDDLYEIDGEEMQKLVNDGMYELCAILENKKCFGLIETADDFRAFNIWHDEESDVDFKLRKKYSNKSK